MANRKSIHLKNPFIYEGFVSPEYFCDRTEETEELISNLQNGRNTTLISPRRIGKTGLIKNAFYHIEKAQKDAICIYIDIFATKNQHDFVQMLGTAIVQQAMSQEKKALNHLLEFFGSWRPVFSADPITGMPTVSVSMEPSQSSTTLKSIFDYLSQSKRPIYIAIDEFQQVALYPETGTEALLRSYIQFAHQVHFVFSGSKQHMMAQIFNSPSRPFYQSTASIGLYPLHEEIYYDFARRFFEARRGGKLSREVFHSMYEQFGGITWNIQMLLNRLYETEKSVDKQSQLNEAIQHVVSRNAMQYESLVYFLTDNQFALLKAIAHAGTVESPQSSTFIRQYGLPGASSVNTALTTLVDKEMICHSSKGYAVYDRFLSLWLQRL